ncbi:MAG TPA: hypothetical protein VLJ42_08695 [Solirubrobacteraceae bacterium]|nr:hypothetical protein [Solirubrobacteraceae bacterium]
MNELLKSLKADLLGRRLLPALLLVGALLCVAVAYAVMGAGGGSGKAGVGAVAAGRPAAATPSVSTAPADPKEAVSETTDGAGYQRQGGAHDPFISLPSPHVAKVKTKKSSAPTSASSSTPSVNGGTGATPTTPKPTPKAQPKKSVYHVAALFGLAPTAPGQSSQLTPYEDLRRLQPLPTKSNALLVFNGVSSSGKSAIFTQLQEGIPHGPGQCLPSALQCQAIALKEGEVEGFEYILPSGQSVTYQLQVVSIAKSEASAASARRSYRLESAAGRSLLLGASPSVLANLRYSWRRGVVTFNAHPHHRHR